MHPALSVIFFTVTSGVGYGLLALMALVRLFSVEIALEKNQLLILGGVGLLLITAGLVASTFHLANPKNAWRAFNRFRTSWLSREGVFAVLFYPVAMAYLYVEWLSLEQGANGLVMFLAVITLLLAVLTVFATGMIYACLKTIRQWNTALTPANYIVLGLMLGALIFTTLVALMSHQIHQTLLSVCVSFILLGALFKAIYYFWIGKPDGPTINTALGFTRATVKLLDVGHSSATFLTEEFGYQVARFKILMLRALVFLLAFIVPLLLLVGVLGEVGLVHLILATVLAYAGVFIERWLFFAEARHVVNLYHGAQTT
jgi:DMSO reductase anchor subunit